LERGDRGDAVQELQRRLSAAGFGPAPARWGEFCPGTQASVLAFQRDRGLRADGVCDEVTWLALAEASWELGDRRLQLCRPNLRGDDVAELQRRLGRLGFDPGRVDGILGPDTANALTEFQRNVELTPDGICGPQTVRALERLRGRSATGPAVAVVRETERLRRGEPTLEGRRVVVGHLGGMGELPRTVGRALQARGSSVLALDDPDGAHQAAAANRFQADVYVGLVTADDATIAFYATAGFESVGGHCLADLLHDELVPLVPHPLGEPQGMRLPVLRETSMPAVLLALRPRRVDLDHSPAVAAGISRALARWVIAPDTVRLD
jgi:N-acetylmuramoyl-L-alanine amidase